MRQGLLSSIFQEHQAPVTQHTFFLLQPDYIEQQEASWNAPLNNRTI
jgi:hypothetical protein